MADLSAWERKQELAAPARYYGDGGTIHGDGTIDIEIVDGKVTEVWFRCQQLPFRVFVDENFHQAAQLVAGEGLPILAGVEVLDRAH